MIAAPMGQMWLWTSIADLCRKRVPITSAFWTTPGYVGRDLPSTVERRTHRCHPGRRVICGLDILKDLEVISPGPHTRVLRTSSSWASPAAPRCPGRRPGFPACRPVTIFAPCCQRRVGSAAGRRLYCHDVRRRCLRLRCAPRSNLLRFDDVRDRRPRARRTTAASWRSATSPRHLVMDDAQFASFARQGFRVPAAPGAGLQSPLMGVSYSGQYEGKLLWVHHTPARRCGPPDPLVYESAVVGAQERSKRSNDHFRLHWTEHAEHVADHPDPPAARAVRPRRGSSTTSRSSNSRSAISPTGSSRARRRRPRPTRTRTARSAFRRRPPSAAASSPSSKSPRERGRVRTSRWAKRSHRVRRSARRWWHHHQRAVGLRWLGFLPVPSRRSRRFDHRGQKLSTKHAYDAPGTYFATALVHSHPRR